MKKFILLLLLTALCISTGVYAQYNVVKRVDINESQVPEYVKASQRQQFRDGFVTKWALHKKNIDIKNDITHYMAVFKKDGRVGNKAYYDTEGNLMAFVIFISSFDLPEGIKLKVKETYRKFNVMSAEFIDLENPKRIIYRVRLNNDGLLKYVYYDNYGNELEKIKLPVEIFSFI